MELLICDCWFMFKRKLLQDMKRNKWEVKKNPEAIKPWVLSFESISLLFLFNFMNYPISLLDYMSQLISLLFKLVRVGFHFLATERQKPNYSRWGGWTLFLLRCLFESSHCGSLILMFTTFSHLTQLPIYHQFMKAPSKSIWAPFVKSSENPSNT